MLWQWSDLDDGEQWKGSSRRGGAEGREVHMPQRQAEQRAFLALSLFLLRLLTLYGPTSWLAFHFMEKGSTRERALPWTIPASQERGLASLLRPSLRLPQTPAQAPLLEYRRLRLHHASKTPTVQVSSSARQL